MPIMFQVVDKFNDALIKSTFSLPVVKTENVIFRLYYKLSIWLVGIYSLFHVYLTINASISCAPSHSDEKVATHIKVVEDYCWSAGTYTVRKASRSIGNQYAYGQIYPGVGSLNSWDDTVIYHHYYKWMYFIIFFKIVSLLLPRYVWRNIECGLMKQLCTKLRKVLILEEDENIKTDIDNLACYFFSNLGNHKKYATGLILCEILNVIIVSFLLFLWDFITGHQLSVHANAAIFHLLNTPGAERNDPLTEVFPIIAKCTFNIHGPGGSMEARDFLCVLPINVVNERAAVIFWYYFMVLIAIGLVQLVFRFMLVLSKRLRANLLKSLTPITPSEEIDLIINRCSYGDWYLFHQFGLNVQPCVYRRVVQQFVAKLREKNELIEVVEVDQSAE